MMAWANNIIVANCASQYYLHILDVPASWPLLCSGPDLWFEEDFTRISIDMKTQKHKQIRVIAKQSSFARHCRLYSCLYDQDICITLGMTSSSSSSFVRQLSYFQAGRCQPDPGVLVQVGQAPLSIRWPVHCAVVHDVLRRRLSHPTCSKRWPSILMNRCWLSLSFFDFMTIPRVKYTVGPALRPVRRSGAPSFVDSPSWYPSNGMSISSCDVVCVQSTY